jgi:acyl-CoA synthetase (AMP-forming)/AMP-acid ligase II
MPGPSYNVASAFREHARTQPDAIALRFPSQDYRTDAPRWDSWRYRDLDHHSDAYARGFRAAGFQPGERVVALLKPSLDFYAVLLGLFKIGCVPVLLDPGMGPRALLACIGQIQPTAMVAVPVVHAIATVVRAPFASMRRRVTVGRRWWWGGQTLESCYLPDAGSFPLEPRGPDDDAAILFTSGSTGTPKGVVQRQAGFDAQVVAIREMFGFRPGGVMVQAFAAFALFDLSWGHTSVLPRMNLSRPATADPADIAAAIRTHDATLAFASPIVWQRMLRWCEATGGRLDHLTTVVTVGAPIPPYLHRRLLPFLGEGAQIWTPYGATEGMPVTQIGTADVLACEAETRAGAGTCVGRAAPGAAIRILQVTDEPMPSWSDALEAPAGAIGEIAVTGLQISREYRDLPDANARSKIRDGDRIWHRMGDLGRLDAEGRLWFCGRKAHRVQVRDGWIPSVPVEQVFNAHPAVFRTALVGVGPPGDALPVLCVELEAGAAWSPALEDELRALAASTVWADVVTRFLPHPGFPTDARHNSKIRNEDLAAWAATQALVKGA